MQQINSIQKIQFHNDLPLKLQVSSTAFLQSFLHKNMSLEEKLQLTNFFIDAVNKMYVMKEKTKTGR